MRAGIYVIPFSVREFDEIPPVAGDALYSGYAYVFDSQTAEKIFIGYKIGVAIACARVESRIGDTKLVFVRNARSGISYIVLAPAPNCFYFIVA